MARTTRSKGSASTAAAPSSTPKAATQSRYTLSPESDNPPRLFILPKKATSEARIVSLLNPRCSKPTRYLVCPETGIYEFTRIAAPRSTPRSWLIEGRSGEVEKKKKKTREKQDESAGEDQDQHDGTEDFGAYVTQDAELYVATPIDPLFLLLPAFATTSASKSERRLFVSSDDHFDAIQEQSPHLWEILRWGKTRTLLESRMKAICETREAGDESMFRFSEEKLLAELLDKARKMSEQGLPKSMEDKFVMKALEAPVLGVKRGATMSVTQTETETETQTQTETTASASESGTKTPKLESGESQSSLCSTDATTSLAFEASTAATSVTTEVTATATEETSTTLTTSELGPTIQASPGVINLQRLRTAFHFICSRYVPPSLTSQLQTRLLVSSETMETTPTADFAPLDAYLAQIAKMRAEAAAARGMGDYSRKRVLDDEEVAERAEKKRRKEEDDKRKKAGESRGVRDLKKVNTAGMRKMSDFFQKK